MPNNHSYVFTWILFILLSGYEGCINNPSMDIVFSLDESYSVSAGVNGNFGDTLNAVADTVSRLNIDTSNGVRVGVMAIHNYTSTRRVFGLNKYNSISDIQSAVLSVSYGGLEGTDMYTGLTYGCSHMFINDYRGVSKYLVYLTHGMTNTTLATIAADNCKAAGITVVIVAIETTADITNLSASATSPSYFLNTDFSCLAGNLARHTYSVTGCQWYCDAGSKLVKGGDPSTYHYNSALTGYTYLFTSSYEQFKCCGRIFSWEFYAKEAGTLSLQVWKPVSVNTYKLVGVNKLYIPSNAVNMVHTYIVPNNERITVNNGDYFGWYSSSTNIIPYQNTGYYYDTAIYINIGDTTRGSIIDFSSGILMRYNQFSIKVTLENDDDSIWFPDSGYRLTLFDHLHSGIIFNWSVAQKDQEFLTYGIRVVPYADSSRFSYAHSGGDVTGYVSLASSIVYGSTYLLTLGASDTCTHCNTGTLSVTVANLPPRISSLPAFYELHEDADLTSNVILHTLVTKDDSGDTVTCSILQTNPSSTIFEVQNNIPSTIILKAGSTLSFDTVSEYEIKVRCTDTKANVDGSFKVFLRRNVPPRITNMFRQVDCLDATYSSCDFGTPLTTDQDSTSFTYSMSYCGSPPESTTCPVSLSSSTTGALQASSSSFTGGGFNVRMNVSDGQTKTGPYPLSVRVYDLNDPPNIFNLPLADKIIITEGIPPNTWLYTAQFYDLNNWNTLSFTTTISPSEGTQYFVITKTIINSDTVQTSSLQINYETLTNKEFTIQFSLSDGKTTTTQSLIIKVQNKNEGLFFASGAYTIAADEGPVDTVVGNPHFVVIDTDSNDSVQFTFDCGTNSKYYKMDYTTGIISYALNMDVDKGYSRQAVCTVTAWDSGYLTATTKLTITINDINDNSPRFDKKYYTFWTSASQPVGTVLGKITITDADITYPNNYVRRIWIANQPNNIKYFNRNETTEDFYINTNLSAIGDGNVLDLIIYAEDYGHLTSSASIAIILPSETTTTSTTTTDTPLNAMETSTTTIWMSCAAIAGMCVCGLALYMCCKYSSAVESSQRSPVDKLPKKKKPGRGRDLVFRDSGIC